MFVRTSVLALSLAVLSSCSSLGSAPPNARADSASGTLIGAWEVTAKRAQGVGMNLLTFSSDGTFFRSGDTHPVLSGAHGAWKSVGPNRYHASYVAFTFDRAGAWNGFNRNNLEIELEPGGNSFHGTARTSTRDLQDRVVSTGQVPLSGKRIQVQPY